MANYFGSCRSSYFSVKDVEAFNQWLREWNCSMIEGNNASIQSEEKKDLVGFISDCEHGLPSFHDKDGCDDEGPDSFLNQLAGHLTKGWAAIVMESGHEKMRYISGQVWAVRSDGEIIYKSLEDIYHDDRVEDDWQTTECTF